MSTIEEKQLRTFIKMVLENLENEELPIKAVVIVAGIYRGNSTGPKGYTRYKPFKYGNSQNSHPIVYAKLFASLDDAIIAAKDANREMLRKMYKTKSKNYIKGFSIVVHDIITDSPVWGNDDLSKSGYLYDGLNSSNDLLHKWGILSNTNAIFACESDLFELKC